MRDAAAAAPLTGKRAPGRTPLAAACSSMFRHGAERLWKGRRTVPRQLS